MNKPIKSAFEFDGLRLPAASILPINFIVTDPQKNPALKRIICAIRVAGLIEPLMVFPQPGSKKLYILLDGHIRFEALKQLGWTEFPCFLSTDDEGYTYNQQVNLVPPVQQHFMILKAIENGVPEEKIAASLNVDIATIRQKRDLINGICPEAVELLKATRTGRDTFRVMRKVTPLRQIEMAELMLSAFNFTASYAKCLLAATPDEHLIDPAEAKQLPGTSPEDAARLEREMQRLEQDMRSVEETHAKNVLNLVLTTGYLRKLLENKAINQFLSKGWADMLAELQKIVVSTSLE